MRFTCITSSLFIGMLLSQVVHAEERFTENSRNENSTPPTSILPFSPAITEQPSQNKKISEQHDIISVKARLMSYGYDIGSLDDRPSAKFISAIYKFQKAHQIATTGTLTPETLSLLYRSAQ